MERSSPAQLSIQHAVLLTRPWPCSLSIPFPCLPRSFFSSVHDLCHRRRREQLQSLVVPWSSRVPLQESNVSSMCSFIVNNYDSMVVVEEASLSDSARIKMENLKSFFQKFGVEIPFDGFNVSRNQYGIYCGYATSEMTWFASLLPREVILYSCWYTGKLAKKGNFTRKVTPLFRSQWLSDPSGKLLSWRQTVLLAGNCCPCGRLFS